jgi:hypothetical protein|tara:strand:+ start:142 stop:1278 length:1137 start_codon:yes stop_codon:yes gene_type:complete
MASIFDTLNPNQSNTMGLLGVQSPLQIPQAQERLAQMQQMQQLNNLQQPQQRPELSRTQGIGLMLSALSDALGGRDVASRSLERQQFLQSQVEDAKRKEEQDELIASMNPETRNVFKTFGPTAAFNYQQQQLAAEAAGLEELRNRKGLQDAGFSEREINLFQNANMTAKDILDLRSEDESESLNQIKNNVNLARSSIDDITGKAPADDLSNLDEAHGSILPGGDAFQELVINEVGRAIGIEPAAETGAAVRAKTELDERILQITTQNYSGRPSVFLLEQITKLIPPVNTSDKDAFESYSKIETRVRGYLQDLEREIQSGKFAGNELELMKSDFRQLYGLQQDLETAKKGLGDFQVNMKPNLDNKSSGNYDGVYLNNTE